MASDTWQNQPGLSHVALAEDGSYSLLETPKDIVVFWGNERPVAHRWFSQGAPEPLAGQIDSQVMALIPAEAVHAVSAQLDASVVICTRDLPEALQRCLASLPQQTYPTREIIVVDNASRDQRTREVATEAGGTISRAIAPLIAPFRAAISSAPWRLASAILHE